MTAAPNHWDLSETRADSSGARRALLPGAAVWLLLVWLYWFEISRESLGAALGEAVTPRAVTLAALAGVFGRIGTQLVETGFYVAAWRTLARPLRFGPLFVAVASLSLLDIAALSLAQWAGDAPPAWLVPLTGFHVLPDVLASQPGLRLGFGGFGLLALARVLGTARAQKPAGAPFRWRLALTAAAWLAGRLATWWSADLMRGMSPLP
jgi:hypothetical protein